MLKIQSLWDGTTKIDVFIFNLSADPRKKLSNSITTTKYTWYTWLPKSIWDQFRRIANVYFLGISILMVSSSVQLLDQFFQLINFQPFLFYNNRIAYRNLCHLFIRLSVRSFLDCDDSYLRLVGYII